MEVVNSSANTLNQNLMDFYHNLVEGITKKVSDISEETSAKLQKTMVYFSIGVVVLTLLLSFIFSGIMLRVMG